MGHKGTLGLAARAAAVVVVSRSKSRAREVKPDRVKTSGSGRKDFSLLDLDSTAVQESILWKPRSGGLYFSPWPYWGCE